MKIEDKKQQEKLISFDRELRESAYRLVKCLLSLQVFSGILR